MMTMHTRSDRNPFAPALWLASILGGLSLLLALARCGPSPYLQPLVSLCVPGCESAGGVCLALADGIDPGPERDSAILGCQAGQAVCSRWCEEAQEAVLDTPEPEDGRMGGAPSEAPGGHCDAFWKGCVRGQGDPDVCSQGAAECRGPQ